MKRFLKWIAAILGIFVILFLAAYFLIMALFDTEPYISNNSYLQITLSGSLPEFEPADALEEYFRGSSLDFEKVRRSLAMAARDDRIKGVILHVGMLRTGFAKMDELHQLLAKFRQSGKKVLAHLEYGTTRDYYLASACDSVYMSPGGNLFLNGFAAEVTFYKGVFDKLGIEADFEHVGEYKNAPEVYTRQSMSAPQREVINEILDSRYRWLLRTVSANRGLDEKVVDDLVETVSAFSPEEAVAHGLIDGIKYADALPDIIKEDSRKLNKTTVSEYAHIDPASVGMDSDTRMAVIYCSGTMTGGEDGVDPVFGQTMGSNRVIRDIRRAAELRSIKAIILRIDSPGGSSLAADEIWHAVKEAAREKPVIASISDMGASGGYYIAIAADTILAQKQSLIGSIGVFIGKFSLEKLYAKINLNTETIKRGKNATLFSLNSKFSDSERLIVKRTISDFYQKFVSKVADSRKKTFAEIDQIARGRVWDGERGLDLNLIDLCGGLDEAVAVARRMAHLDEDTPVQLVNYPKSKSLIDQYFGGIDILVSTINDPFEQIEKQLQEIQMRAIARMPFNLEIN